MESKVINLERIEKKVSSIKAIQERRVRNGETYHNVGDAICLDVDEAEYLINIIKSNLKEKKAWSLK